MRIGAVVLAAGGSTRLGSPKQLLSYGGRSLLRRAADSALAAVDGGPVVVVLGAGAAAFREELAGLPVLVVENPDWSRGMGTSVRAGLGALEEAASAPDAALLTLCDQPLVTALELSGLVAAFRRAEGADGHQAIVAAAYGESVGVPAVFGRAYFEELRALPDDAGAKPVLRRHGKRVTPVPMPTAATDIDTREQYENLLHT